MWKPLLAAGTALVLVLLAHGSSASAPAAAHSSLTCVNATAAHKAYLVVQHLNGAVVETCVGFDAGQLSGGDLMKQSGMGYQTQRFTFGMAVCSIDREPVQFTACFPSDGPWWSLWVLSGSAGWARADTAYNGVALKDRDALGWHYDTSESPPPLPRR